MSLRKNIFDEDTMNKISFYNVIGPVMIGPSSSHTAGACRIGRAARAICGEGFNKIHFKLYGSFAKTYMGHGTDKALIAGCLGLRSDDERIKTAYTLADEAGIDLTFEEVDLVNAHPNTAIIEFEYPNGTMKSVTGISTGGGQIEITRIGGDEVQIFPGDPTIILQYADRKGIISLVSKILYENDYNIELIRNNVNDKEITLILILDKKLDEDTYEKIKTCMDFDHITYVYF